jgi:Flp pilus assembly pilin Flp
MIDRLNAIIVKALYSPVRAQVTLKRQDGQAFVEYALVLTLVAVAVVLILQWGAFTGALHDALQRVINALNGAGTGTGTTPAAT